MTLPVVSVVIPTAGRRPMELARAIESVAHQTIAEAVEIIVVDDSRDGLDIPSLAGAAGPASLSVVDADDMTVGQRSLGVRRARGQFVAFLDDDDIWMPTKLEKQVALGRQLEASGGSAVVSCRLEHTFDGTTNRASGVPDRLIGSSLSVGEYLFYRRRPSAKRACLYTSTLLVSRSLASAIEWRRLPRHQDWDWLLRAGQVDRVAFAHHPEVLATIHVGSAGSISASANWRNSLDWAMQAYADGLLADRVYADFLVGQPLRYALTARSRSGARAVVAELRRLGVRPSMSTSVVGLAGLAPRKQLQRLMAGRKSR